MLKKKFPFTATIVYIGTALLELVKLTAIVLFFKGVGKCLYGEPLDCSGIMVMTALLQDTVLQCC